MRRWHFAWVDREDNTFSATEHAREDEKVFSFRLAQSEGEFASLDILVINPRIGLLSPSRKQWMWLSYSDDDEEPVPLFFGRLLGVPRHMQDDIVELGFVARPYEYEAMRAALADALRVFPYYDPVWFSEEDRNDPDRVLEGYSAVWHVDRVSHEMTKSDIITGEDGLVEFQQPIRNTVEVEVGPSPARRVVVEAAVNWTEMGAGGFDVTQQVLKEFRDASPALLYDIHGNERPWEGTIPVIGGEQLIDRWPEKGKRVGAGWSVGESSAKGSGFDPTKPLHLGDASVLAELRNTGRSAQSRAAVILKLIDRSPGYVLQVVDTTVGGIGRIQYVWVPIWRVAATLSFDWAVQRSRTEVVEFAVTADVQSILTDPGEEETVYLTVGPADVDDFIGDSRRNRYFDTDRGQHSFEHLLARARSIILARARAVNVSFEVPFQEVTSLTCRHSGRVVDPRLPGGQATGKVVGYSITMDGGSGALRGRVTIGCSIGRDGEVTSAPGEPTYVEDGYVDGGWQQYSGGVLVPFAQPDIGYDDYRGYAIDSDGVDLTDVSPQEYVQVMDVSGTLLTQEDRFIDGYSTVVQLYDKADGFETTLHIQLKPLTGGPFLTPLSASVHDVKVPRTIDLEAE